MKFYRDNEEVGPHTRYFVEFLVYNSSSYCFVFSEHYNQKPDIEVFKEDIEWPEELFISLVFDELPIPVKKFLKGIKFNRAMKDLLGD